MYSLKQLYRGISNPKLLFREANRIYYRQTSRASYNTAGVDIFAEDWDNLILLDACRYDMFASSHDLDGTLDSRISRGSSTSEFLVGNFDGKDLCDTVYVTANPQLHRNRDRINVDLHHIEDVWLEDGWDADLGTVLPETMNKYAKRAAEEFPRKRLIIHYIQPHYPFISGETEADKGHINDPEGKLNVWNQLMNGQFNQEQEQKVVQSYYENLDEVIPAVEELLEHLEGKTVVTSDHGNMLGERAFPFPIREWGHPRGLYMEQLTKVPWHTHQNGERKVIEAESHDEVELEATEAAEDRLEQLGYI